MCVTNFVEYYSVHFQSSFSSFQLFHRLFCNCITQNIRVLKRKNAVTDEHCKICRGEKKTLFRNLSWDALYLSSYHCNSNLHWIVSLSLITTRHFYWNKQVTIRFIDLCINSFVNKNGYIELVNQMKSSTNKSPVVYIYNYSIWFPNS